VIAGHNGAGKTTIYRERIADALSQFLEYHINPDEIELAIVQDLGFGAHSKDEFSRLAAAEANRLRRQLLDQERNFSFETVFSDPKQEKANFMAEARRRGYLVVLLAVGLESVEKSKERVAIRHSKGGHDVPADRLESRYPRVLENFAHGAIAASLALVMDNSEDREDDAQDTYWDIAFFEDGRLVTTDNSPPDWWENVLRHLNKFAA
jgi:predicted ABC-type ATPase